MNAALTTDRLAAVQQRIALAARAAGRDPATVRLVAVSKTKAIAEIRPALDAGHRLFGENRVQEAVAKWPALRASYSGIELHLIGPLQTNKAAEAVALFDVIESLDREKLARVLAAEMKKQAKHVPCFVQVNTGREPQKAGISPAACDDFVALCRGELGLTIAGLMCIPPLGEDPAPHFEMLAAMARRNALAGLSMGMSGDYEIAIARGATHVRVGGAIFGERTPHP